MVLYYAMGGGLGHLVRAEAFLLMKRITGFRVITASPYAVKIFDPDRLVIIPREFEDHVKLLTEYFQGILEKYKPDKVIIDTFSHGILGELNGINWRNTEVIYITRRLKWEKYRSKVPGPGIFSETHILEPIEPDHLEFIQHSCRKIIQAVISYPVHRIDPANRWALPADKEKWVIVHSGPDKEVDRLIDLTFEMARLEGSHPMIFVNSQDRPRSGEVEWSNQYPVRGYFPFFRRIITACGFNSINETAPYRDRHRFFPFERKYDDQFWRAQQAKKNG